MPRAKATLDEDANNRSLDPLIDALLEHLPEPGEQFPQRALWLQVMEMSLKLAYPEPAKPAAVNEPPKPPTPFVKA